MSTLTRDKLYNFRVNSKQLEKAKEILQARDISISDALNLFVNQIIEKNDLPIKTQEEVKAEKFLAQLTDELDKGYQDVLNGRLLDADEVFREYDL
ncbi:type II toxin-antitoxin system RelB/ParD family antitoxin [Streptococcus downei]|uniref:Plasmid stabilisation system, antitoxin protein n=1 Tax=Streptococcus downei MFe28 TaxID=764290 RepID=A0A380JEN0_STRDO|nr:type II toxin-antitoxin system RelB/DinJ family antitoxin [Streptococcus downei]EFQ57355.1 addiction module antitoxin, RelB/DinJ family [Streptococcus downei F0415]SUN36324.1 plasmid stabilisation system, antitoxin protein [Streptococcus downei MFe28]